MNEWNEDKIFLAYVAGFIDGEGTLGLYKRVRGRYTSYTSYVSLPNTHYGVLSYIHERIGLGTLKLKKATEGHLGNKEVYVITLTGRNARILMYALVPYLIIKKTQAEVLLDVPVKWGHNTQEEIINKKLKNEIAFTKLKELHGRIAN